MVLLPYCKSLAVLFVIIVSLISVRISPPLLNYSSYQGVSPTLGNAKFGCPACVAAATTVVSGVAGLTNVTLHKGNAAVATSISTAMGGFTGAFLLSMGSLLGSLTAPVALLGGAVASAFTAWNILRTQNHNSITDQK